MSRVVLITQLQQTLKQLWDLEIQATLSEIPTQQLLETLKERLCANPATAEEQAALTALFQSIGHVPNEEPLSTDIPEHVSVGWIITKLGIGHSSFYRSVHNILLFPILKIGNRPYYLKADVLVLFDKVKGKGTYFLGRMASKLKQGQS